MAIELIITAVLGCLLSRFGPMPMAAILIPFAAAEAVYLRRFSGYSGVEATSAFAVLVVLGEMAYLVGLALTAGSRPPRWT